jgi:hypothetical protein
MVSMLKVESMSHEIKVLFVERLTRWALIVTSAMLLAICWVTTALAQADGDGDGFDGDELAVPMVLAVGVLAYLGWTTYRRRSHKRPD